MMSQAAPLQTSNAKPKQSDSSGLLLQRKCACGSNASALTGECEECGTKRMQGLQTKLEISEPGDRYEQEANRVADAVVAGRPVGAIGGPPPGTAQRKCAQCEAAEEVTLRRKEAAPPSTQHVWRHTADAAPIAVAHGGAPLTAEQRAYFEPRFGHDLSQVRIHDGVRAAELSHRINARAFTHGRDIYFGAGQYSAAESTNGQHLLAHELTHTLQQFSGNKSMLFRAPLEGEKKFASKDALRLHMLEEELIKQLEIKRNEEKSERDLAEEAIRQFKEKYPERFRKIDEQNRHHVWPKYLGGPEIQQRYSFTKEMHVLLHIELDGRLPRFGPEAIKWDQLSINQKKGVLNKLKDFISDFDKSHKTRLLKSLGLAFETQKEKTLLLNLKLHLIN